MKNIFSNALDYGLPFFHFERCEIFQTDINIADLDGAAFLLPDFSLLGKF